MMDDGQAHRVMDSFLVCTNNHQLPLFLPLHFSFTARNVTCSASAAAHLYLIEIRRSRWSYERRKGKPVLIDRTRASSRIKRERERSTFDYTSKAHRRIPHVDQKWNFFHPSNFVFIPFLFLFFPMVGIASGSNSHDPPPMPPPTWIARRCVIISQRGKIRVSLQIQRRFQRFDSLAVGWFGHVRQRLRRRRHDFPQSVGPFFTIGFFFSVVVVVERSWYTELFDGTGKFSFSCCCIISEIC